MPTTAVPLNMPEDLLETVRAAAKKTHLSMADVMRQAIKVGVPVVVERLEAQNPPPGHFAKDYPLPKERLELEAAMSKTGAGPDR